MKWFLLLFAFLTPVLANGEIIVNGNVISAETNTPVAGASVLIKGEDGKIKKFGTSKEGGSFELKVPSIDGCRLEVTKMGYEKEIIPLDSVAFPLSIYLEKGATLLKEVTIKADRIREQGDTISYNVGAFAQTQDRSIGDVLKRMPGINVENSGRIQYQGEDINKFYIEGSDLLGGKYGIATNGINYDDVGAVEVMENHQPLQVLAGMAYSSKAAINLKLKNKAKATWSVHGKAGGGYSWQPQGGIWDSDIFVMAVMSGYQNMTTIRSNNIGDDLSSSSTDFFATINSTDLNRYIALTLPGVPDLKRKRTLFNKSLLVSTNNLWKMGKAELKTQIDYSFSHSISDANNITTYFLEEGNREVTEKRTGRERNNSLSAKLIYELNHKTAFINNTLKTNIDWNDISLHMTGNISNTQSASLPKYYVGNDFKLIKRFSGKHLVTFKSLNEWESLPQDLTISGMGSLMKQTVRDHAFVTHESAEYSIYIKGLTISMESGVKGYFRSLNSVLPDIPDFLIGDRNNAMATNFVSVYATPKFEYWIKRVNIQLNVPLSYVYYHFNKVIANRHEGFFSPVLTFNWKPNNKIILRVGGGINRSPMDLNNIHPGYIMTDYRSFSKGADTFFTSGTQNLSGNFSYKHTRHGLFANLYIRQSWSSRPYMTGQYLYGDYVVYSLIKSKGNSLNFIANGSIGKTLDFMKGSIRVDGGYNESRTELLAQDNRVNSRNRSWNTGVTIGGTPVRWFSFDYHILFSSSRLSMGDMNASWLYNMENDLMLNFMPHRKWEWHISGEHYRNELMADNFKNVFLLDTKLVYKLSKKLEISMVVNNILNQRTYNYTTYDQWSSFESQRWLRGREVLLTLTLRK
ncbi:MAG: TonB-dependent receptor [Muribaculaceae bacterium]|nr:TonB-dependent receptor [Muribaculaceae bacterium]